MGADAPQQGKDAATDEQEPQDEKTKLTDKLETERTIETTTGIAALLSALIGSQRLGSLVRENTDIKPETLRLLGTTESQESRQHIVQQVLFENLAVKQSTALEGVIGVSVALMLYLVQNQVRKGIHGIEDKLEQLKKTTEKDSEKGREVADKAEK